MLSQQPLNLLPTILSESWVGLCSNRLEPPLCSNSHLVVVQVFIWFNRHHRALYRLHWQGCALGAVPLKLFAVSETLKFTPNNTYRRSSWIKFQQKVSIGNHILSTLSPAVSLLEVVFLDSVELNWSPRSMRPSVYSNDFIKLSIWLGKCFQYYQKHIWTNNCQWIRICYIHYGLHNPNSHPFFKR